MRSRAPFRVIQGLKNYSHRSTLPRRPRIHGAATSSKPLPPLIALCEEKIPERLLERLRHLDGEQLQIVEVVVMAIARGQL